VVVQEVLDNLLVTAAAVVVLVVLEQVRVFL